MSTTATEYDRRAQKFVHDRLNGSPDTGSVRFAIEYAAHSWGEAPEVVATWTQGGKDYWKFVTSDETVSDLTSFLRDLLGESEASQ